MTQWQAYGATLACELPVIALLARNRILPSGQSEIGLARLLAISVLASSLTHPLAWRAAMASSPDHYPLALGLIETAVVLTEAVLYWGLARAPLSQAFLWSLLANGASAMLGWWWQA